MTDPIQKFASAALLAIFASCQPSAEVGSHEEAAGELAKESNPDLNSDRIITDSKGIEMTGEKIIERKIKTTVERRPSQPTSEQARKIAEEAIAPSEQ